MSGRDGGHAFPITAGPYAHSPGMSLRAWLVGQALAGSANEFNAILDDEESARTKVERAMLVADIAIAALEVKP